LINIHSQFSRFIHQSFQTILLLLSAIKVVFNLIKLHPMEFSFSSTNTFLQHLFFLLQSLHNISCIWNRLLYTDFRHCSGSALVSHWYFVGPGSRRHCSKSALYHISPFVGPRSCPHFFFFQFTFLTLVFTTLRTLCYALK